MASANHAFLAVSLSALDPAAYCPYFWRPKEVGGRELLHIIGVACSGEEIDVSGAAVFDFRVSVATAVAASVGARVVAEILAVFRHQATAMAQLRVAVEPVPTEAPPAIESASPKPRKRRKKKQKLSLDIEAEPTCAEAVVTPEESPQEPEDEPLLFDPRTDPETAKYWKRRYSLWSRFDEGVWMDRDMWFSVSPEEVAKHTAERMSCGLVVDGFCGAGGNSIQLAATCQHVVAIDIDPLKIKQAKHNAEIYGVADKITFLVGDFFEIAPQYIGQADAVFMSPPWGGTEYRTQTKSKKQKRHFALSSLPIPINKAVDLAFAVAGKRHVVLFLPCSIDVADIERLRARLQTQLTDTAASAEVWAEIEYNYRDMYLTTATVYFTQGDPELLDDPDAPRVWMTEFAFEIGVPYDPDQAAEDGPEGDTGVTDQVQQASLEGEVEEAQQRPRKRHKR
eukprot:TRINITY_DN5345_c0_g1_i3.p1 TRINITY_DN5345_c0_g1~~TRINITY_DN5345_c0_g1_i3.p1  ORF type:complete len:452 (-),score=108.63 TRINITY_DN5345_c0_g1_i3:17-1372(-)